MALKAGVSTKANVYDSFGQPHAVEYSASGSDWRYFTVQMRSNGLEFVPFLGIAAGGQNADTKTTDIYFDTHEHFASVASKSKTQFVQNWYGLVEGITRMATDDKKKRVQAEMAKIGRPYDPKIANSVSTE